MFGSQALRLLREYWPNAKMLAEELYAMFLDTVPLEHEGGLTLKGQGVQSPLRIVRRAGDPGPAIVFNYGDEEAGRISIGEDGGFVFDAPSFTFTTTIVQNDSDGDGEEDEDAAGDTEITTGGGGMPGTVVSGSGNTYQVRVYPDGLDEAGEVVECRQLYIDSSVSLPAGTFAIVAKAGESYYMQVPVWGPDLT